MFKENLSLDDLPVLVVMIITPFAAFEPYNEVDAASFKTLKLSISFELILLISPANGTPSTIYRGLFDPLTELNPRILTSGAAPGCPPEL